MSMCSKIAMLAKSTSTFVPTHFHFPFGSLLSFLSVVFSFSPTTTPDTSQVFSLTESNAALNTKSVEQTTTYINLSESWIILIEAWFSSTVSCSSPKTAKLVDTIKLLRSKKY